MCSIETIPLPTYSCVYMYSHVYTYSCVYIHVHVHVQSCIYIHVHTAVYTYMYMYTHHRVMNTQYSVGYSSPVNVCCYLRPHLILIAALGHGRQLLGLALGGGPAGVVLELPASIVCGVRLVLLLVLLLLLLLLWLPWGAPLVILPATLIRLRVPTVLLVIHLVWCVVCGVYVCVCVYVMCM